MNNLWLTIGIPATSSLVSAFLAVQLALRRFYREKWWERRLNAYLQVIEALHTIGKLGSEWADQEILRYDKSEKERNTERLAFKSARNELNRAVAIGELMLSEEAVTSIALCQAHLDRIDMNVLGPLDYYEEINHTAATGLMKMRALVKRDLSLESRTWWPKWRSSN